MYAECSIEYLEDLLLPPGVPFLLLSVFLFCRLMRRFSSMSAPSDISTSLLLGNIFQCAAMSAHLLSYWRQNKSSLRFNSLAKPLFAKVPLSSDDKVPGILNQIVSVVVRIGRTLRPLHQVDSVVCAE